MIQQWKQRVGILSLVLCMSGWCVAQALQKDIGITSPIDRSTMPIGFPSVLEELRVEPVANLLFSAKVTQTLTVTGPNQTTRVSTRSVSISRDRDGRLLEHQDDSKGTSFTVVDSGNGIRLHCMQAQGFCFQSATPVISVQKSASDKNSGVPTELLASGHLFGRATQHRRRIPQNTGSKPNKSRPADWDGWVLPTEHMCAEVNRTLSNRSITLTTKVDKLSLGTFESATFDAPRTMEIRAVTRPAQNTGNTEGRAK